MNHPSIERLIEPSPEVAEHLARCAACRAERELFMELFSGGDTPAPADGAATLAELHRAGAAYGDLRFADVAVGDRGVALRPRAAQPPGPASGAAALGRAPELRGGGRSAAGDRYALGVLMRSLAAQCADAPEGLGALCEELTRDDPGDAELLARLALLPDAGEARYPVPGALGAGGMGEVLRVADAPLGREVALKRLHPRLARDPGQRRRFVSEAQTIAQLQHPGIVPVHELGRLPDGRAYFTMREIRGRTLKEVIAAVHDASRGGRWRAAPAEDGRPGWTFERLLTAFQRVCEALAYAHERGVVHRDLKPENVMVGEHGEVLVVDWGLARVRGRPDHSAEAGALDPVVTRRSAQGAARTLMGQVMGTPAYMPPEQARGELDRIDARSDVYTLGGILYEILSGRAPYVGDDAREVLDRVLAGPPDPPDQPAGGACELAAGPRLPLPGELVAICQRAMAREPADRYRDAQALSEAVGGWVEGAARRERALAIVQRAVALGPEERRLRERAGALRTEAEAALAEIPSWAPEAEKRAAWGQRAEAEALEVEADRLELERVEGLRAAFTHAPELPEAHAALARHYHTLHREAERRGDRRRAVACEARLRLHDRGRYAAYLRGHGALTLETDPPGALARLYRYRPDGLRLEPRFERELGRTPLREVPLEMGSYLLTLEAPGRAVVRYPVRIQRQEHWVGAAPEREGAPPGPRAVYLPPRGALDPEDCYVPGGWALLGQAGAPFATLPLERRWVDGFILRRFPVTQARFLVFLNDLVARGLEEQALAWAPRERAGAPGVQGPLIYGRDAIGRFVLQEDSDGDAWRPGWPACMLSWHAATAYCRWFSEREGRHGPRAAWRLPTELEWEKAARGVDGRAFPWGEGHDPSFAHTAGSHRGRRLLAEVDTCPLDESPYGARGLGGNVRDWCADAVDEGELVTRGGAWPGSLADAMSARRYFFSAGIRTPYIGFRLCRTYPL